MVPHVTDDGWLRVPYTGPDIAIIKIEVPDGAGWKDAYLDYSEGQRVAQIRWRGPVPHPINVQVNGDIVARY